MRIILLAAIFLMPMSLFAQKKALFEYEFFKDSVPFNIKEDVLTYADSNSTISFNIKPTAYLASPLPPGITWEIPGIQITGATGKRAAFSQRAGGPSFSLKQMSRIVKSVEEMQKKHLPSNPRIVIEVTRVVGTKDGEQKSFPIMSVLTINIKEE